MATTHEQAESATEDLRLSVVRGDAPFRIQRALGLIPAHGLGLGRRALLLAVVSWVPIAAWAELAGRAFPGVAAEPLLQHFGIQVRCLIAIPLLVIAEGITHAVTMRVVPYFVSSGLVRAADRDAFRQIVQRVVRLRDGTMPWVVIAGVALAWTCLAPLAEHLHEVVWAGEGPPDAPQLGFGGLWFVYVVRPIYLGLLLTWVWRLLLIFVLLRGIARLDLALVPSHPDRACGLGFVEQIPSCFSLVALAVSAVVASRWAHEVLYHGVHVDSLRLPAIALLVVNVLLFTGPLLAFVPRLAAFKRQALLDYGTLVGEQGRLVQRRWIERDASVGDEALLSAPEIGPVADALSLYEAVATARVFLVGKRALLSIALPTALPLLAVFAIEVPIKELLKTLLGALV